MEPSSETEEDYVPEPESVHSESSESSHDDMHHHGDMMHSHHTGHDHHHHHHEEPVVHAHGDHIHSHAGGDSYHKHTVGEPVLGDDGHEPEIKVIKTKVVREPAYAPPAKAVEVVKVAYVAPPKPKFELSDEFVGYAAPVKVELSPPKPTYKSTQPDWLTAWMGGLS